jgi:hypothetical protein
MKSNNFVKRGAGLIGLMCFVAGASVLIGNDPYYAGDMPSWLFKLCSGLQWVWALLSIVTLFAFTAGFKNTRELSFAGSAIWTVIFLSVFIDALTGPYMTVTMPALTMLRGSLVVFVVPAIIGIDAFEDAYSQ